VRDDPAPLAGTSMSCAWAIARATPLDIEVTMEETASTTPHPAAREEKAPL
jgi:hypothetical protein